MNQFSQLQNVRYFEETDSTNRIARELARDGAGDWTVVAADRQTAGRGRLGKSFHSPQGGLYMSVILRPKVSPEDMMALTACTAVAVFQALREFCVETRIKWVNDLFLHGRKICGILCEGGFGADGQLEYLVAGIGINLQPDTELPEELREIVTDIASETGLSIPREALIPAILRHLETLLQELPARTFLQDYKAYSYTLGKRVRFSADSGEQEGLAVDVTETGALVVRKEDGSERIVSTGTAAIVEK